MIPAPHGAICAALLAQAMAVNIQALRARAAGHASLKKYREAAVLLTGDADADAEDAASWTGMLCGKLSVAPLGMLGLRREQIPALVEKAQRANRMKGNPLPLTPAELSEIVERSL